MKEQQLFKYLKICCYPDLVKAKKQMSQWDCYSPTTFHRIELKCRSTHYETLLIEKKKYDALMLKCSDNLDIPMYINSTPKGIYRFDLRLFKPKWELQYHNKTTEFTNKNKIPKVIAMLDINKAQQL